MSACPSCNTDDAAGTRRCTICHTNVVNLNIGRLASPGKRLGAYFVDYFALLLFVPMYCIGDLLGFFIDAGAISTVSLILLAAYVVLNLFLFARSMTIWKKAARHPRGDGGRQCGRLFDDADPGVDRQVVFSSV